MSPPSETEVRGSRRARQLGLSIGVVLFLVLLLLPTTKKFSRITLI